MSCPALPAYIGMGPAYLVQRSQTRSADALSGAIHNSPGTRRVGHISEIAEAEPPYLPRGCPFQAWLFAELLRLDRIMLADAEALD